MAKWWLWCCLSCGTPSSEQIWKHTLTRSKFLPLWNLGILQFPPASTWRQLGHDTVPLCTSSIPAWAVGLPREHSCLLHQTQLRPMHIYEGGILLKQLSTANTVSAKSGYCIEKLFFHEKHWNAIIHFIMKVDVFFCCVLNSNYGFRSLVI